MKGYIFEVKPHGGTSKIIEYINKSEGQTSEWCFGLHLEFIDEEKMKVHMPKDILEDYLNIERTADMIANCIAEVTSINFSYIPKQFANIYNAGPVEINRHQLLTFKLK